MPPSSPGAQPVRPSGRRRAAIVVMMGVAAALLTPASAAAQSDGSPADFRTRIDNLETTVERLRREFANPHAIVHRFPEQKRLIDARVFYELGNYESAAIVLMDVIEAPSFRGNLEYEAGALLLGKSLLEIGNIRAARHYLERVSDGRDRALAEEARFYLIEMALTEESETLLRDVVRSVSGDATSDRARYGLGKAWLRLGEPQRATRWLEMIGPASSYYPMARYYVGVTQTQRGDLDAALSTFRALTALDVDVDEDEDGEGSRVHDLTWLAVGRLHTELGDIPSALTSYQQIGRDSPYYEVALYEMAWAYINVEQYDRALVTVDILLLTVEDDQIDVDAHVLRGRLNVMMDDFDEAVGSYQAIIDRFAPIRNELARFSRDPGDIQRYFQWLLSRGDTAERLSAPLSQRTSRWIESTRDISRVARVFDRIGLEAAEITEARRVGVDLESILSAKSRIELFPNLRDGWARAIVAENRLVAMSSRILEAQAQRVRGRMTPADAAEHGELVEWRERLEAQSRELPTSFEAYTARRERVNAQFAELDRKRFIVEQQVEQVKRELLAIERYLNDRQYADRGEKLPEERERGIRADLEEEKSAMQGLLEELLALERAIEVAQRRTGAGDDTGDGARNLKQALFDAHRREGEFYDRLSARIGGDLGAEFEAYSRLRGRIAQARLGLDAVIAAIDDEVELKTAELRGQVAKELGALASYAAEVERYDAAGRELARAMGEELFRRAQGRMDQVVLEADVGLLDVAWEEKQRATRALQDVGRERADRLRSLQADLEGLQSSAGGDPMARRPGAEGADEADDGEDDDDGEDGDGEGDGEGDGDGGGGDS